MSSVGSWRIVVQTCVRSRSPTAVNKFVYSTKLTVNFYLRKNINDIISQYYLLLSTRYIVTNSQLINSSSLMYALQILMSAPLIVWKNVIVSGLVLLMFTYVSFSDSYAETPSCKRATTAVRTAVPSVVRSTHPTRLIPMSTGKTRLE